MPTYEFECKTCGKKFTMMESIAAHDSHRETCPACGGMKIDNLISAACVQTEKKS